VVARRLARKFGGHVSVDDLRSLGNSALPEIVDTWDPSRGTFEAYASQRLTWAMRDGVRRETHGRSAAARARALLASDRVSRAYAADADEPGTTAEAHVGALDQLLRAHAGAMALAFMTADPEAEEVEDPEQRLVTLERRRVVRAAIAALGERERALIERHYFGGEQFDAIAADLGVTKSWASRLHARALAALGPALAELRDR